MDKNSAEDAARLERECFSNPWSAKMLAQELINPLAVFIIARIGEESAGYAGMHHVEDEGYIANIAVAEKYRRGGIASAMLEWYIEYARENGLRMLTLEVRESNGPAQRLYAKYGFVREGRRVGYYTNPREDALILTLRFNTQQQKGS